MRERHGEVMAHAANSAATLRDPAAHFDMVRCGVAIYGLDPFQEDPAAHGLEPALELSSYVAAVKRFEPGRARATGGAGPPRSRRWSPPCRSATATAGGAALTNNCDVLIRGERRPLVGTVSMDNVTVAVGDDVEIGDEAVLIGSQGGERILCEEVAKRLGHDQLRGDLRPEPAGEACLSAGWSGERSATACSAGESRRSRHRGGGRSRAGRARVRRRARAGRCSSSRRRSAPGAR